MGLGNFVDIKLRFIFQYLLLSNIETKAPSGKVAVEMALQMGAGGMQKIYLSVSGTGTGPGVFLHATRIGYGLYVYAQSQFAYIESYASVQSDNGSITRDMALHPFPNGLLSSTLRHSMWCVLQF